MVAIQARAIGAEEHFLLNPFGLHFSEITASSLVKVDLDGDVVDPGSTQLGINRAGYVIHSAIHAARKDIKCIVHVHTTAGAAVSTTEPSFTSPYYSLPQVSAMSCGLLPITQPALSVRQACFFVLTKQIHIHHSLVECLITNIMA